MQGFNMGRYVPPDQEGTTTGNRLHGKRPRPTPTVRFEMPFAIWCSSCPRPTLIGQGVRFNAEKTRAGNYYSTPIWRFRFRHAECGGAIEMRTDPRNTAYVVVEGATKRDTGNDDDKDMGAAVVMTDGERAALRANAFASLEKTIADREQLRAATDRIDSLLDASARHWRDPYAQNQRLRREFRAGRKTRERAAQRDQDLRDKMSLGDMDLLPETDEDARRAAIVDFEGPLTGGQAHEALSKPLFAGTAAKAKPKDDNGIASLPTKKQEAVAKRKDAFASQVMSNTRAAMDPFLQKTPRGSGASRLPGIKRKRTDNHGNGSDNGLGAAGDDDPVLGDPAPALAAGASNGLVQYDDSD